MKNILVLSFLLILGLGNLKAQEIEVVKYEQLNSIFNEDSTKLTVVNFWATWCGPCVDEMPYFVEATEKYKNENVRFVFVSLDRIKQLDSVKNFAKKFKMNGKLLLLDDAKRMNEWIPAIQKNWQGNIPVTILYKDGQQILFHGEEISKDELFKQIDQYK